MNMGPWETRLAALASSKSDVALPNAAELVAKLDALRRITTSAQSDVGLQGETGEAADGALNAVATRADTISQQIATVNSTVENANSHRRSVANGELDKLDANAPGALTGAQANVLQSAVTGATFFLGPLSIVAGPSAVAVVNNFLAANRESTARASVQKVSQAMDAAAEGLLVDRTTPATPGTPPGPGSNAPAGGGPTGGGLPGGVPGGSFGSYPGAHIEPLSQVDTGGVISLPHTGGTIGGGHTVTGATPGTGIDGSITPDGPISGGSTTPGWGSGGSNGGLGGGNGGGFGSTPGLAAGAGGALALGGAKLVAARGGSMLGSGLNAKVGSLGAGGAGGKLGGLSGAAESAAARSGSLAGAGRAGTGGLLGSGSGSGAAGAAGEGAAARGGAGAGMMGGAGGAGRSDEKRQGRGLGGPIAPKIDEDQERGPRSASAGPGGRG